MSAVEIKYKGTKSGKWKDHDFINLKNEPSPAMYREIKSYMAENYTGAKESANRFNEKEHVVYFKNALGESFKVDLTPLGIYEKNCK